MTACVRINAIVALVLVKFWFVMTNAADASVHQLKLYQELLELRPFFSTLVEAVIKKLQTHLWFLTEEMVPLAVTSSLLNDEDRKNLAQVQN